MALQGHQCLEMEPSDAETLVLGEGDTTILREQHTKEQIKAILMMGVAKVSRHHHRAAQPLLEDAGVESAWRDAMNIVDVLHDKTPEHNCRCVQPPDMQAMNMLLHDTMKRISADIGKTARRFARRTNAMMQMHRNARRLVKKFYDASKNNGKKLAMAKRR